jgi:hypothetical protein
LWSEMYNTDLEFACNCFLKKHSIN